MGIRKVSFKKVVVSSVLTFYIIFIVIIYFVFNGIYYKNFMKNFRNEMLSMTSVSQNLINEEMESIVRDSRIAANSEINYYALSENSYLSIKDRYEKNNKPEKSLEMNRMMYIKLANQLRSSIYGLSRGSEEKGIALYDADLNLKGYSEYFPKEVLPTGKEKYMTDCIAGKDFIDNIGIEVSTIEKKGDTLVIKGMAPVGKNIRYLAKDYRGPCGITVIVEKIDQSFIEKIKKNINREIVVVDNKRIIISTVYNNDEIVKNYILTNELKSNYDKFFREIKINNEKYGFAFSPIKDYSGNIIAYIGVGDNIEKISSLYKGSIKKFLIYGIFLSILLFVVIYFILKRLFMPFDLVFDSINGMKEGSYREINVKSYGELRVLVNNMNKLSAEICKREQELRELNQHLEEKVADRTTELQETIEKLEKTQEELLIKEKMASIGKLAAGLAHEINNPLSAILAGIQMIKDDLKNGNFEENGENVDIVEAAAKKARGIISKLLRYMEKGHSIIEKVEVDELIFRAVSITEREVREEGVFIEIDIEDGLAIKGSLVDLSQVLTSIIVNAKDAIIKKNGEDKKIRIKTYSKYNKVFIEICDNGIGISHEDKLKIFDPFFTTKEIGKGVGLGLTLSYEMMKKNDGEINVESKVGEGTKFTLEFNREM